MRLRTPALAVQVEPEARGPNVTERIEQIAQAPVPGSPHPKRRRRNPFAWIGRTGIGVWIGLLFAAGGFGLLAYTWGETAALTDVALQVPYVVSGGFSGLGLILLGLLVVNISVKRRETRARERQLEELRDALAGLRAAIEDGREER